MLKREPTRLQKAPVKALRIVVEHTPGVWRYVAKIVPFKKGDGGFALIPAYAGHHGLLAKVKASDSFSQLVQPPPPSFFDTRSISHRSKLSFHRDGMTQFSAAAGNTVLSGLDAEGKFKGMGVYGHTFAAPVWSGSIFCLTVFGLAYYPIAHQTKDTVRFSMTDLAKRGILSSTNYAIALHGFLIRRLENVTLIGFPPDFRLRAHRWSQISGSKEKMELRIGNLHNEDSYLAIDCFRVPKPQTGRNSTGYILSSHRDTTGTGLLAFYPPAPFETFGSLDRGLLKPRIIKPDE